MQIERKSSKDRYKNLIHYFSNWYVYFLDKVFKKEVLSLKTRKKGISIKVPRKVRGVFKEVFFDDFYTYNWLKDNTQGNIHVIDIGANTGFFTWMVLEKLNVEKLICAEPMPGSFEVINNGVHWNKLHDKVIALNQAVTKPGVEHIELFFGDSNELSVSASQFSENKHLKDIKKVPATSLDKIIDAYNFPKIDILKMDCEGSEYDIFYNLEAKYFDKVRLIAMETHDLDKDDMNTIKLTRFLESRDFEVFSARIDDKTHMLWAKNKKL